MWYKNVRAQNFLIFFLSFAGLSSFLYLVNFKPQMSLEVRHQIEEIVFSSLFNYISDHPDEDPDYFFISVSGSDPSPRVLNNFNGNIPIVEPVSSSIKTFGFSAPVTHRSQRTKKGIIIDLEIIDTQPNGNVRVLTSLYQNRISSATHEFTLSENDGIYRIIRINHASSSL